MRPASSASATAPHQLRAPYGSAEENFGRILARDLRPYRDELIIFRKAGYDM